MSLADWMAKGELGLSLPKARAGSWRSPWRLEQGSPEAKLS